MCAEKESFACGKGLPPLAQGWTKVLSSKVGSSPGFGSGLDYNAGVPPARRIVDLQVSDIVSAFSF